MNIPIKFLAQEARQKSNILECKRKGRRGLFTTGFLGHCTTSKGLSCTKREHIFFYYHKVDAEYFFLFDNFFRQYFPTKP